MGHQRSYSCCRPGRNVAILQSRQFCTKLVSVAQQQRRCVHVHTAVDLQLYVRLCTRPYLSERGIDHMKLVYILVLNLVRILNLVYVIQWFIVSVIMVSRWTIHRAKPGGLFISRPWLLTQWIHRDTHEGHGTRQQVPAVPRKHTHYGSSTAKPAKEPIPRAIKFLTLVPWQLRLMELKEPKRTQN